MSRIKGRGNRSTELALLRILKQHKLTGWRRHLPLPGRPDFCFPKQKVAIFVDGCFWHRCPQCWQAPKNNAAFWADKIGGNVKRDEENTRLLRAQGWSVIRIWEHDLGETGQVAERLITEINRFRD